MRHLIWRILIICAWISIQAYLFISKYTAIMKSKNLKTTRDILGVTIGISRASALLINFNSALIIFCCCRVTLSWLRSLTVMHKLRLPIDDAITFHKLLGHSLAAWSIVHVICHYFNYARLARRTGQNVWEMLFLHNTGLSGHLLVLVLASVVLTSAIPIIRRKRFELFFYLHKLFIFYCILLSIHGAFCFVKTDDQRKPCIPPQSWMWITPGLALFIMETLFTMVRSRRFTYVSKVILHQSKVFELQIRKPSFTFTPGQYVLLQVPAVSWFQWHPFTITSAPEDDFISLHIRVVGDWTNHVADEFGIKEDPRTRSFGTVIETPSSMPKVHIDGPYGAPCENFSKYEVVVCIGAGIGQTPFSSVLRSIWYNVVHPTETIVLRKVIYIGICRSVEVSVYALEVCYNLTLGI